MAKKEKKEKIVPQSTKNIDGFSLINAEKLDRVISGVVGREGKSFGGIGEKFDDAGNLTNGAEILAAYDKLGGLVLKDGNKLKTGCFYDFEKKQAKKTPEIVYIFRDLEGDEVEVPEGEEVPLEVKAAEIAQKAKAAKKVKRPKKSIEDEE